MADISALTNLQATDPIDLSIYADAKEAPPLPRKGRYVVQAPPRFDAGAFGATGEGYLSAQVDPIIVGPKNEGYLIRFTRVSAKLFDRGKAKASQLGDYLRSTGIQSGTLSTPQQQANVVEQTAGRTYQVDGDWEVYCKGCKWRLKGEEVFPKKEDGSPSEYTECPTCLAPADASGNVPLDEKGNPKHLRLRANFRVVKFVPAS